MNITFKKFKNFSSLSDETTCFTADVYADGVLIGHAKNEGSGGCTFISSPKGKNMSQVYEFTEKFETTTGCRLDNHVDELVEANIQYKKFKRLMKITKLFYENGNYYKGVPKTNKAYIFNDHTEAENIEFIWRVEFPA